MTIQEANQIVHQVENDWGYEYLIPAGFTPITKQAKGLVRKFQYKRGDEIISVHTGASSDYWRSNKANVKGGYWNDLKEYLES